MTKKENDSNEINTVVLRTSNDNIELSMIKELLDQNQIPYIIKEQGIGGYMRIISGSSLYGTDILVEESVFEKADAIINEFPWNDEE